MDLDADDKDSVYSTEDFIADVGFPALTALALLILAILATLITALI